MRIPQTIGRCAASVRSWAAASAAALWLVALAHGQVLPGDRATPLAVASWVRGELPAVGAPGAPAATVYTFYVGAGAGTRHLAEGDAVLCRSLMALAPGVRVVAVVDTDDDGEPRALAGDWTSCSVAVVDAASDAGTRWLGDELSANWHVLVVDARGLVTFVGCPGAGLHDAVVATLAGRFDQKGARSAMAARRLTGFDDGPFELMLSELRRACDHAPHDGMLAGLRYALLAQAGDRAAAGQRLALDLAHFAAAEPAGSGRALALYADLALRAGPRAPGVAESLCQPLAVAAAAAPKDRVLALAHLRALVLAHRGRDVGRKVMQVRKLVMQDGDACLAFAEILAQAEEPAVHADLANQAVQRAAELQVQPRHLAAARYVVALRCGGDRNLAAAAFVDYVERLQLRVSINNDCWYFLTEVATMGRYDAFAAALAERMLEQRDAMDYFEFDTAALAMFRAGRLGEAVELQQQAIDKGGKDEAAYRERLRRYEAAAAAAPR